MSAQVALIAEAERQETEVIPKGLSKKVSPLKCVPLRVGVHNKGLLCLIQPSSRSMTGVGGKHHLALEANSTYYYVIC